MWNISKTDKKILNESCNLCAFYMRYYTIYNYVYVIKNDKIIGLNWSMQFAAECECKQLENGTICKDFNECAFSAFLADNSYHLR